jgi:YihY family inner membrane protein
LAVTAVDDERPVGRPGRWRPLHGATANVRRVRARRALRHRGAQRRPAREGFWRAVYHLADRADVYGLASQIAFNAVFSLGPLLSLVLLFVSSLPVGSVQSTVQRLIPVVLPQATHGFVTAILRQLQRPGHPLLLVASLTGLVWTLSSASSALVLGLETVGLPRRESWVKTRLRAALLGVLAAVGLTVLAAAVTLGEGVVDFVARVAGRRYDILDLVQYPWVRLPVSGGVFAFIAGLFFRWGTTHRPAWRATGAGALFAGTMSAVASAALSFYLALAPRLGGGYGAATGFFGVLLWLYVLGLALCLGGCVTHVLDEAVQHARHRPAPRISRTSLTPPGVSPPPP